MRVPLSWLREHADLPEVPARQVANRLIFAGLEVEAVESVGADVRGVRIGEVLAVQELTGFRKPVRYCSVEVGDGAPRGIVCGATNVAAGDRVPVALPGAVLPGGFEITARKTYGQVSDGMICSARELGLGEDHTGILVLSPSAEVGADAVEELRLRDDVLDIAVTPDRGYCWSMRGVAREAALAFDVAFRDPAGGPPPSCPPEPVQAAKAGYPVEVEDRSACDRYLARALSGLDPAGQSPLEVRRRLLLAGMRPISAAVDATNYVLLDLGQPLHAFDRARLRGPLVVRRARAGERLRTLDGVTRSLDPDDLMITDDSGPIALAGVMGGGPTEVGASTTELLIESAHFDPYVVARAARRHKLATEASKRFERGVDDELPAAAADAAVSLLVDWTGAKEEPEVTDVDSRQPRPTIRLRVDLPARVAGRPYSAEVTRRRLADVGCEVTGDVSGDEQALSVAAPSWRPDLVRPIDLADEVIRLEGYDTVPTTLPAAPAGRGLTREQRQRRRLAAAMAGAGYIETPTYPFGSPHVLDALRFPADDARRRTVALANPLDDGEPLLRTTLLPGLFGVLGRNVSRGFADLALFELGPVFQARPDAPPVPRPPGGLRPDDTVLAALDAALPAQPLHLAVVLTGLRQPAGWWGAGRPAGWADAVQAGRRAGKALGVALAVRPGQQPPWHPGRCAEFVLFRPDGGEAVVGHAGEVHPGVLEVLGLPPRTCAMEIDVAPLIDAGGAESGDPTGAAPVISAYPIATVDIAVVVNDGVPVAAVEAALRDGAGELLEAIELFDVYHGAQLGDGRKSLAFALRLRAADRTLTSAEVVAARDAALRAAAAETGATLRGS